MEKRKPFERAMLRNLTEKTYLEKLEKIIISEGKRILNALRRHFIIIHEQQIERFLQKHPEFLGVHWHQIGLYDLYHVYGEVSVHEYKILIAMKQILNKNDKYILRSDEFDNRKYARECDRFQDKNVDVCYQDCCRAALCCPKFYVIKENKKCLKPRND